MQWFVEDISFLERILMEHIGTKISLDSKLQNYSICSTRIRSRKWNIFEKPKQLNSNSSVDREVEVLGTFQKCNLL